MMCALVAHPKLKVEADTGEGGHEDHGASIVEGFRQWIKRIHHQHYAEKVCPLSSPQFFQLIVQVEVRLKFDFDIERSNDQKLSLSYYFKYFIFNHNMF